MSKPVAEVIEWEETYGHTFKKRTVSTVKWLENVEVGTKLYTHPVKQLTKSKFGNIVDACDKSGDYDAEYDFQKMYELIIKEITE